MCRKSLVRMSLTISCPSQLAQYTKKNWKTTSNNKVKVSVYDISGRLILDTNFENSTIFNQNINLDNAQSGIYLLTVTDGEIKETRKIVVE